MKNKLILFITTFSILVFASFSFGNTKIKANTNIDEYYYNQLVTEDSKNIYEALEEIKTKDKFKTGDYTIDLVEEGYLENRYYDQNLINADFVAARDAFMFDNPNLFYIDYSKISLRQIQNENDYRFMLGIGREDNYYNLGFNKGNVNNAIEEFNTKVDEIVTSTNAKRDLVSKIEVAYTNVIKSSLYRLEKDASKENINYVRNPYGTLVRGESICEGYSRSLKIILDALNIENVLVQGSYIYNNEPQLHMWNYVQLDDYNWYLLDPTMEQGLNPNGTTRKYFLKTTSDDVLLDYVENGILSVASDKNVFEFTYPTLAKSPYNSPENNPFKFTTENDVNYASYNNKGIKANEDLGKYIIFTWSLDNLEEATWYYYSLYHASILVAQGQEGTLEDIDSLEKFNIKALNGYPAYFGITNIKPEYSFDDIISNPNNIDKINFNHSYDEIYDISNPTSKPTNIKPAPYALKKSPSGAPLEQNKTYNVSIKYNEELKKIYNDNPITITSSSNEGSVEVSNINFIDNNTITFTFTTKTTYRRTLSYYFQPTNLVGINSSKAPSETSFTIVNNIEFACPLVEGAINTIYTNTPALVADSDLSTEGWIDKDGNKITDVPSRFALVASKPSAEDTENMNSEINKQGDKVLKSETYNINLELCNTQISYMNGSKVKVLMPFPEGYSSKDKGVSFKAYHFNKDGKAEEIECIVTENGIIMLCDSFSPFAVVAVEGENKSKKVITNIKGNAKVDKDFMILNDNEGLEINISLDSNNVIDYVKLNDKFIKITDNKIILSYNDLKDTNFIEVATVLKSISDSEIKEGFTSNIIGNNEEKPGTNNPSIPNEETEDSDQPKEDKPILIYVSITLGALTVAIIVVLVIYLKFIRKKNK